MNAHSPQVEVPEWYTAGFMPPETQSSSFERDMDGLDLHRRSEQVEHAAPTLEHWELLGGGHLLSECRDTVGPIHTPNRPLCPVLDLPMTRSIAKFHMSSMTACITK